MKNEILHKVSKRDGNTYAYLKVDVKKDSSVTISSKRNKFAVEVSKLLANSDYENMKQMMSEMNQNWIDIKHELKNSGHIPLTTIRADLLNNVQKKQRQLLYYDFYLEFVNDIVSYQTEIDSFVHSINAVKLAIVSQAYRWHSNGISSFTAREMEYATGYSKSTVSYYLKSLCDNEIFSREKYCGSTSYTYGFTAKGLDICDNIILAPKRNENLKERLELIGPMMMIRSSFLGKEKESSGLNVEEK